MKKGTAIQDTYVNSCMYVNVALMKVNENSGTTMVLSFKYMRITRYKNTRQDTYRVDS